MTRPRTSRSMSSPQDDVRAGPQRVASAFIQDQGSYRQDQGQLHIMGNRI
jgi:hypothetical protein